MNASTAIRPVRSAGGGDGVDLVDRRARAASRTGRACRPRAPGSSTSAWRWFGSAMYTTSTSGDASSAVVGAERSGRCRARPANAAARSASRLATATSSPRAQPRDAPDHPRRDAAGAEDAPAERRHVRIEDAFRASASHPDRPRGLDIWRLDTHRGHVRAYHKHLKERNTNPVFLGRDEVGQRSETVRRANLSAIVRELHIRAARSRGRSWSRGPGSPGARSAASSASSSPPTSCPRSGPRRSARPAGRRRSSGPTPRARRPRPRDRGRLAGGGLVGLGGEVLDLVRVDRPRGHSSVDADRRRPGRAGQPWSGPAGRRAIRCVGIGVAIVGVVRRSDGFVSMAPNLGWRDVPARRAAGAGARHDGPDLRRQRRRPGRPRRGPPGRRDRRRRRPVHLRRGRRRRRAHRRRQAAHRRRGLSAARSATCRSTRTAPPCRCGSVGCWETEVGEARAAPAGRHPPGGGRARGRRGPARGRGGIAGGARRPRQRRPLARLRAGRPRQHLQPAAHRPGRPLRPDPSIRRPDHRRASSTAGRCPPPASSSGSSRRSLGVDAPLLGAAELAFEPLLADPATWLRPRATLSELASA